MTRRAPFQVSVLPYTKGPEEKPLYAVFRRPQDDGGYWQFIAGGGEQAETPLETGKREASEEAGI